MRIRISRKEAKESGDWLRLVDVDGQQEIDTERAALLQEAAELTKIFGSILSKCQHKDM